MLNKMSMKIPLWTILFQAKQAEYLHVLLAKTEAKSEVN